MLSSPPTTFGDLLRHHRQAAGLTQQGLAERAGLSVHGIQKLERGATHPYRDTAQRLIAELQLAPDELACFRAAIAPVRRHGTAPQTAPPGQTRDNLPQPITSLIGREAAVHEIAERVADGRLLTLTGVGGCGKTRLALEVAHGMLDRFSGGVWLVELAPLVDPALVPQRVGAALGVRETAEQPLEIALSNALRDRELLLVLDNCEHLLDACAQLVDGLLRACPGVRVLATSREPIGIGGETAWRVPSLPVPKAQLATAPEHLLEYPAVQLFVQRAIAAQPRFALTARNAASVVQICRRLDGIPLALELAAARVEALTAEQVAQRLDQRVRLLTGGSRAALPRLQTLSATLEWSYDLLTSNERRLFERLAVFAGGWTLEAAEAVCAGQGVAVDDVLDLLAALTRKSLVIAEETVDGAERYSLPETVRDYARQKLGTRGVREITALRQRHADFYAAVVEQLPDRVSDADMREPYAFRSDSVRRADAEHDNLRAMLGWWLETGRAAPGLRVARRLTGWWMIRGLYGEGRQWLTAQIELDERTAHDGTSRADEVSPVDRAFALGAIGLFTSRQGDYQESHARYEASAAIWRELGDTAALGVCLSWLGLNAWCRDEVEDMRAERLAGHTLADCLDWLAALMDVEGRPREAAVLFGAADAHWQASGAVRYAPERAAHAAELASVQAKVSADEFAAAWAEGHAMSREQAVDYALELTQA
jgi:predicted ATPase/DNA-binding XRE family transcriptional regulator